MEILYIYILIGFIGGITAGMLGLGGGIIFVPGLMIIHKTQELYHGYEIQVAIYTSLICIIFAGFTSSFLHYKNKLIDITILRKFLIYISAGCFVGIYLLELTSTSILETIYSIILIILALILISDSAIIKNNMKTFNKAGSTYFFANGVISSLMGIGGGTLSVPYLQFITNNIRVSIATASVFGLAISLTSILFMYVINSNILIDKINYDSLLVIVPTSVLGSYCGVILLKSINPSFVKKIFSTVLIVIAIYLFID